MRSLYAGLGICFVLYLLAGYFAPLHAAVFLLEPDKKSVRTGEDFTVTLTIDTQGEKPLAADAVIIFDSANLNLVKVAPPPDSEKFFKEIYNRVNNNKVYIGAAVGPQGEPKSGKGPVALLSFKGISQSQNVVSFACDDGKTTDSNISTKADKGINDVITCVSLKDAYYNVSNNTTTSGTPAPTSGNSPTPNPSISGSPTPRITAILTASPSATLIPTATKTATSTPTIILSPVLSLTPVPSDMPNTGIVETTILAAGVGLVFVLVSLGIKFIL